MADLEDGAEGIRYAIRIQLNALSQSLPSLMQQFVCARESDFSWQTTGRVYQYTKMDTLRSMLGGSIFDTPSDGLILGSIWATSSAYLNDSQEFHIGKQLISDALHGIGGGAGDELLDVMKLALEASVSLEVYCACFSAVGDDLSQWRGYGDNGSGVCLGFDLEDLLEGIDGVGYWVVYGKSGNNHLQSGLAEDLVKYVYGALRSAVLTVTDPKLEGSTGARTIPPEALDEIRHQLTRIWPTLCLVFKHRDFEAEREFRIVYSDAVDRTVSPSFRAPMVPFVRLMMRRGRDSRVRLRHVRLGPAARSNLGSTRLALRKLRLDSVDVEASDIPYVPR